MVVAQALSSFFCSPVEKISKGWDGVLYCLAQKAARESYTRISQTEKSITYALSFSTRETAQLFQVSAKNCMRLCEFTLKVLQFVLMQCVEVEKFRYCSWYCSFRNSKLSNTRKLCRVDCSSILTQTTHDIGVFSGFPG